jgi:hypothetical protein
MQVRQILVASVLAVSAAAAMSQEIDRGETLQARSLASQQVQAQPQLATASETVVVVTAQTDEAPIAKAPHHLRATKTYSKTWLHGDRRDRSIVVADRA